MPDVQEIIDGLRAEAYRPTASSVTQWTPLVELPVAVAAVHAAADARTQETLVGLREQASLIAPDADREAVERAVAYMEAKWLARRFPNGGTHK